MYIFKDSAIALLIDCSRVSTKLLHAQGTKKNLCDSLYCDILLYCNIVKLYLQYLGGMPLILYSWFIDEESDGDKSKGLP